MAVQRPLKEGNVRTYQEKVGLGFTDILASEADADHDTIYAAWNAGLDTPDIHDSAITSAKLAANAVIIGKINPGAVRGSATAGFPQREIAQKSIQGNADIYDATILTEQLADNAVTMPKLAANTVRDYHIGAGQVTTPKLAAQAVTVAQLGIGASVAAVVGTERTTDTVINSGTMVVVMRVDLSAYRGGPLYSLINLCGYVQLADGALTEMKFDLYRPTGFFARRSFIAQGSAGLVMPFGVSFLRYLNVGAGADWLELRATRTLGTATWAVREGEMLMTGFA
jgi:hypothetical protein